MFKADSKNITLNPKIEAEILADMGPEEGARTITFAKRGLMLGLQVFATEDSYLICYQYAVLAEAEKDPTDLVLALADALENLFGKVAFSPSLVAGTESVGTLKGCRQKDPSTFNLILQSLDQALSAL